MASFETEKIDRLSWGYHNFFGMGPSRTKAEEISLIGL